jgi:hypothetical protein
LHELRPTLRGSSLLVGVGVLDVYTPLNLGFVPILRDELIESARKIATICHHLVKSAALNNPAVDHEVDIINFR